MGHTVLITAEIDRQGIEYLKEHGCKVLNEDGRRLSDITEYTGYDGLITRSEIIDQQVYSHVPSLRVVAKHGVGVDNIDVQEATKRGIRVVNAPEANTTSVVEHTLTLICSIAKNLCTADVQTRAGNFHARERIESIELKGKTLGLVGFGRIGRQVAWGAAYGFGMNVMTYDPYIKDSELGSDIRLAATLEELLSDSDFISLHLPALPSTEKLIGKRELSLMKQSAYLVNTARGQIVDEQALYEALRDRSIAGAALDVFQEEPPSSDTELFNLDNVIVTPHNAALTKEARVKMALHAAIGVVEVLTGQEPRWPVN